MKLRRKIVKILQNKNWNKNKQFPSRAELERDISGRFFLRLNYWHIRYKPFENKVTDVLGDILPPHDKLSRIETRNDYLIDYDYDDEAERLKVTSYGREYLDWLGGWEDLMKRRSRTTKPIYGALWQGIISGIVSTIGIGLLWLFLNYIWPLIIQ